MASRSQSPNPSRSCPSLNPRTPESSSPLRRSFSGCKPDSLQNGTKSAARSPAVSTNKNFMAPTISTASKTIAASPRRRILAERNENEPEDICSQEIFGKKESKKSVAGTTVSSPAAAMPPLDADPSIPPYDPKTNYLSPRPRFLHYKPNPRFQREEDDDGADLFELGLGNAKRVEDEFSSESSEDTSVEISEESSFENKLMTYEENSVEEEIKDEVKVEEGEEEEENLEEYNEPNVSGPASNTGSSAKISRRSYFPRSGVVLLLLMSVFACFFVPLSDSPIKYQYVSRISDTEYLVEVANFTNVVFREVANRIEHRANPSSLYMYPELEEIGSSLFRSANFTTSTLEQSEESSPVPVEPIKEEKVADDELEDNVLGNCGEEQPQRISVHQSEEEPGVANSVEEKGMEIPETKVEHDTENESKVFEMGSEVEPSNLEDQLEANNVLIEKKQEETHLAHVMQNVDVAVKDFSGNLLATPKVKEGSSERVDGMNNHLEFSYDDLSSHSLQQLQSLKSFSKDKFSKQTATWASLLGVVLLGMVALLNIKKKSPSVIAHESFPVGKAKSMSGSSEKPLSSNYKEEMDLNVTGYSGPFEISSSLHTTSRGRRTVKKQPEEETLIIERTPRRDSTCSSSTYGSFTTYERLPAKKGCGIEGEVTPVRRSNRIRQLTSP